MKLLTAEPILTSEHRSRHVASPVYNLRIFPFFLLWHLYNKQHHLISMGNDLYDSFAGFLLEKMCIWLFTVCIAEWCWSCILEIHMALSIENVKYYSNKENT